MTNREYKQMALVSLKGHWLQEFGIMLLYYLFFLFQYFFIPEESILLPVIFSLVLTPLSFGVMNHYLKIADNRRNNGLADLVEFYTKKEVIGLYILNFVIGFFVFLWTLLFIIPGIIASFAYALALYIRFEHPDADAIDCIRISSIWMKGNKFKYFRLIFSFIGWFMLISLSAAFLGVFASLAFALIMPYYYLSIAFFYIDIRDSRLDAPFEEIKVDELIDFGSGI